MEIRAPSHRDHELSSGFQDEEIQLGPILIGTGHMRDTAKDWPYSPAFQPKCLIKCSMSLKALPSLDGPGPDRPRCGSVGVARFCLRICLPCSTVPCLTRRFLDKGVLRLAENGESFDLEHPKERFCRGFDASARQVFPCSLMSDPIAEIYIMSRREKYWNSIFGTAWGGGREAS